MAHEDWRHNLDQWIPVFIGVDFEIEKSVLVIVDMQRYYTDPAGPIGNVLKRSYPESFQYFYDRLAQTVIPKLARVLNEYRRLGLPVIHITSGTTRSDGRDLSPHLQRRFAGKSKVAEAFNLLQVGGKWHEVVAELAPQPGEMVLNKTSRSAFHSTGMEQLLRNLGLGQLLVGGIASNGCVDLTARDAADLGFETFLLEDGCGTFTEDAHVPVFRTFHKVFGTVLAVDDVLQE